MKTTIQRCGNSLALRIPKAFAEENHVKEGTAVDLTLSDGALVVRPAERAKESLRALLSGVDSANINLAAFDDDPRGKEIW